MLVTKKKPAGRVTKPIPSKAKLSTTFTSLVLKVVRGISPGQTKTYGQVAAAAGNPKGQRAVGKILNSYDVKIWGRLPCHRVVGARNIGGYRWGIEKKFKLLKKEGISI